jgi:hypothetical protein
MALQLFAVGERTRWVSVDWRARRLGGVLAIVGALTLLITTLLHPAGVSPNDAPSAFAEYAQAQSWVALHLGQLLGSFGIAGCLLLLSLELFRRCRAGLWAVLGAAGAVASLATAIAL